MTTTELDTMTTNHRTLSLMAYCAPSDDAERVVMATIDRDLERVALAFYRASARR